MKQSQTEDIDEATTDRSEVRSRLEDIFGDQLSDVEFELTLDTQMRMQEYELSDIDEEEVLAETDEYVVVTNPDVWWPSNSIPEQDSEETEQAIKYMMNNIYADVARQHIGVDELTTITGSVDVAVVFVE